MSGGESVSPPDLAAVRRFVTHSLADTDLNFQLGAREGGAPLWKVGFADGPEIFIAPDGEWLRISTAPASRPASAHERLLRAAAQLPMARLALDESGGWFAATELPWAEATSVQLRRAIATVLLAHKQGREAVEP